MIKIEMLRAFREVARHESLVQGARAIGRTPSAVSMTLKSLEEHLGAPLFEGERKNRLTALGRHSLALAERELMHFDRTLAELHSFADAQSGEIRLASVPSFARAVLPDLIAAFRRRHPGLRFDVRDMDSGTILAELAAETVDLGIVSRPPDHPEIARLPLMADRFGLIVPASEASPTTGSLAWADLAGRALLDNPLCDSISLAPLAQARQGAALRIHNTTTLLAMVRSGLGVTVLPDLVLRGESRDPELAFLPLFDPVVRREVNLVWRAGERMNPAAEALQGFLAEWPAADPRGGSAGR